MVRGLSPFSDGTVPSCRMGRCRSRYLVSADHCDRKAKIHMHNPAPARVHFHARTHATGTHSRPRTAQSLCAHMSDSMRADGGA